MRAGSRWAVPLVAAALGVALSGCAAGRLNDIAANARITASGSSVQTALRAEARRLVQPLPASRAQASGGMTIGKMLSMLVEGVPPEEQAVAAPVVKEDSAEIRASRYLVARGGTAAPDLAAIEADLLDKTTGAARFAGAVRTVLIWHGQLRSGSLAGPDKAPDGAKLASVIAEDQTVVDDTCRIFQEQAAVLTTAVGLVLPRLDRERAERLRGLAAELDAWAVRLNVLAGRGRPGALS